MSDSGNNPILNKIGGGLRAAHGMGETIRGTINDALDQGGDMIANRNANTVDSRSTSNAGTTGLTSSTSSHQTVAQKGQAELKEGFDRMAGRPKDASMADAGTQNLPPGASSRAVPPAPGGSVGTTGTTSGGGSF